MEKGRLVKLVGLGCVGICECGILCVGIGIFVSYDLFPTAGPVLKIFQVFCLILPALPYILYHSPGQKSRGLVKIFLKNF